MIEIRNELNEILLSGVVGDGWGEDPITHLAVEKALRAFNGSPVTVRINSPGGAADEGIGIYNAMKSYSGEITTINDSLAASAASVIFLGGSKRLMSQGSRVMIHRALAFALGNQEELRKTIAALEAYDKSLVAIYAEYMDKTAAEIETMMSNETWINADEAIDLGIATGNVESNYKKKRPASRFDEAKAAMLRAQLNARLTH